LIDSQLINVIDKLLTTEGTSGVIGAEQMLQLYDTMKNLVDVKKKMNGIISICKNNIFAATA
jgi:hypothetical protein